MNMQPEALRLAELLEQRGYSSLTMSVRLVDREIAAEMRRLNEVNQMLVSSLNRVLPQYQSLLLDCNLSSKETVNQAIAALTKAKEQV